MGVGDYLSVTTQGQNFAAARNDTVVYSKDAGGLGGLWDCPYAHAHSSRSFLARWRYGSVRAGVYYTRLSKTWLWIHRLPFAMWTI